VKTALNAIVSAWRRQRREWQWQQTERPPPDQEPAAPFDEDLLRAIRDLPERQRQVLALRVFLDLDTEHTADVLGIAPCTASAHLARAIARLRHQFLSTTRTECTT
jgi:RNA polymerase sigma factor (sigma-70 family)